MFDNLQRIIEEQRKLVSIHGAEFISSGTYLDKQDYEAYKNGELEFKNIDRIQEMKILYILEKLGFSMDLVGTYYFKKIIKKAMEEVFNKECEPEILELNIKNKYSQFYVDIARNELGIGLKTFHKYIEGVIEQIDFQNEKNLISQIYNSSYEMDYTTLAYTIANYMVENLNIINEIKKEELPLTRKLVNPSEIHN